ncbi:MAG: hypothetical protein RL238_2374 [Actinomycetota bacterium]|jgi:hypothetical protein
MIEGGTPGGSAQSQAAERRANAERLLSEATRLDATAADERSMAAHLAELPSSYTVLHDLNLPGGRGSVEHVVIGPGGAFLIASRRVDGPLSVQGDQLFHGSTPAKPLLDSARAQAQSLTQSLGTPVVPVLGLLGTPVPDTVPPAIDGVLVCAADQMTRVLSRGSHTLLPSTKVAEVGERAVPLLVVAGTRPRGVVATTPSPAVPAPPPPLPTAPPAADAAPAAASAAHKGGLHHPHTRRFWIAVVASACLVAFAGGALFRVLRSDGEPSVATDAVASSTTIFIDASSTTLDPAASTLAPTTVPGAAPVAPVPAPSVNVLPVCPTPGAGWSLVPGWPGDLAGLAQYELEVLGPDGAWSLVGAFATADAVTTAALTGQAPNITVTLRITAAMADGSRSPATATPVITPATAC